MFCPQCRAEYREGYTECSDCQVPLVKELPPEPTPEYVDLVTVLETTDAAAFAVAESILQASDIDYVVQNEGLENVFPQFGGMQIQVEARLVEQARAALRDIDKAPPHEE